MEQENKNPQYLTEIISSPEIFVALKKIESAIGLNIDQTGELYVLISEIISEKIKSSDFIEQVKKRLGVSIDIANKIAEETNKNIFYIVKEKIQNKSIDEETTSPNTTLERVGNFSIEPTIGEGIDGSTGPGTHWKEVTAADRNKILAGVEDPGKLGGTSSSSRSEESHAEPIVDYLLQNSVGQRERTDVVSHTHASSAPPTNLPVVETNPPTTPVTAKSTPPVSTLVVPSSTPKQNLQTSTTPPAKTPVAPPRSGPDPYHEPVA